MIKIMPNDIVKHVPTGETWVVCGVCHDTDELVPCGYPPVIAKISDCELIESQHERQTQKERDYLTANFGPRFIDVGDRANK
ncbi:hypothetical protein M7775_13600 [Sporomusa sphaeroides DSM 2875]|uniref:hypothetical protein n=1 Tax=Sporomusa sphaeroides TaxID=47679 RepID=UPI00202FAA89|nr:hypothetical protein [Sporomusa sphaeroides]MCM0759588.1 hypothetical protein [Sporomusa sphaeroides DSM 2875]